MKDLLPTILKVLDILPLKGYRNLVFLGLTAVTVALGQFGVLKPDVVSIAIPGLIGLTGYYAAKHE